MKTVYETNSTDLIPDSLGQIKVAYSGKKKKNKFGPECWERQSPWATSALAHLSDGLAKTGNTDPLYLAIFQDCVYIRANSLDTCYKRNVFTKPTVPLL